MIEIEQNKIKVLFVYYCSVTDKQHPSSLKLNGFRRMLSDMQISPTVVFDLIFYENNQKNKSLNFQQFINKLPKVAKVVFGSMQNLPKLIKIHMMPLYKWLLQNKIFGKGVAAINNDNLTQEMFLELKSIRHQLSCIYKKYFKNNLQQNWVILKKMAFEFQIVPKCITSSLNYLIYLFFQESKSQSVFSVWFQTDNKTFNEFTLAKYLIIVAKVANESNPNQQKQILSPIQQLKVIFETIQLSPGYKQLAKQNRLQFLINNNAQKNQNKPVKLQATLASLGFTSSIRMNYHQYKICLDVLKEQDTYLRTIFRYYSKCQWSKTQFIKACHQLHLQKARLQFNSNNEIIPLEQIFKQHSLNDRMNYEGFKAGLLTMAMQKDHFSNSEWLLYLFQKIAGSSISHSICKAYGMKEDPLFPLKKRFKNTYANLASKLYSRKKQHHIHIEFT